MRRKHHVVSMCVHKTPGGISPLGRDCLRTGSTSWYRERRCTLPKLHKSSWEAEWWCMSNTRKPFNWKSLEQSHQGFTPSCWSLGSECVKVNVKNQYPDLMNLSFVLQFYPSYTEACIMFPCSYSSYALLLLKGNITQQKLSSPSSHEERLMTNVMKHQQLRLVVCVPAFAAG